MIKERLKLIRNNLGLTQSHFAKELGIAKGTYVRYEYGERMLPGDVLALIAERGYDINWLLTGSGQMTVEKPSEEIVSLRNELSTAKDTIKKMDDILEKGREEADQRSRGNLLPGIEGA